MTFRYLLVKLISFPRKIIETLLSLVIKSRKEILEKLRNRTVLIVGNGPSLNSTNLEHIGGVHIGMNKINLLFDKTEWRPDVIVSVNGLVIRQNRNFFNSTNIPLILPYKAILLGIKPRKNIFFVKVGGEVNFQSFSQLNKLVAGATVTTNALQVASYLEATEINIVGVDHNFDYTGKSNDISKMAGDDVNHFDPNYFKGQLWGNPDLIKSEEEYERANEIFKRKCVKVTDYTIKGKLTIFAKGKIADIYHKTDE